MDLQITVDATPEEARAELARWLDSGEYTQTRGALCHRSFDQEAYCCLGVAAEIGVALGLVTKKIDTEDAYKGGLVGVGNYVTYDEQQGTLPRALQSFFGMSATGVLIDESADEYKAFPVPANGWPSEPGVPELTGYNDRLLANFHQIAAVVRTGKFRLPPVR